MNKKTKGKKGVYRLNFNCGRMGELTGVFIATDQQVNKLISSKIAVYFGEVLGKHSEVFGKIDTNNISLISDIPDVVKVVREHKLVSGYNPFHYTAINVDEKYENKTVSDIIDEMLTEKTDA
jgi:hypothetical protein